MDFGHSLHRYRPLSNVSVGMRQPTHDIHRTHVPHSLFPLFSHPLMGSRSRLRQHRQGCGSSACHHLYGCYCFCHRHSLAVLCSLVSTGRLWSGPLQGLPTCTLVLPPALQIRPNLHSGPGGTCSSRTQEWGGRA